MFVSPLAALTAWEEVGNEGLDRGEGVGLLAFTLDMTVVAFAPARCRSRRRADPG